MARLGATLLLSGFLGTVAVTVATATDDPPPAPTVVRHVHTPAGHHRVRWALYLREHRAATRLGRRVRRLRARLLELRQQLERARHVQAAAGPTGSLPAHYTAWLCIHRYEGAWDANTGNGYFGGLQMDIQFQQTYGPELLAAKGTADHWTPLEQMQVAERAYVSGRGFYPWPNTARMCGLL